jgi:hypothetical protein
MFGQWIVNLKGDFNTEGTEGTEKQGREKRTEKNYRRGEQRRRERREEKRLCLPVAVSTIERFISGVYLR